MLWVTYVALEVSLFAYNAFFHPDSGTRKGSLNTIYTRFNDHRTSKKWLFSNNINILAIKSMDCQGRIDILLCPFCFHYHTALLCERHLWLPLMCIRVYLPGSAAEIRFLGTAIARGLERQIFSLPLSYYSEIDTFCRHLKIGKNLTLPGEISGGNFCAHALSSHLGSHSFGYGISFPVMFGMYVQNTHKTVTTNSQA